MNIPVIPAVTERESEPVRTELKVNNLSLYETSTFVLTTLNASPPSSQRTRLHRPETLRGLWLEKEGWTGGVISIKPHIVLKRPRLDL